MSATVLLLDVGNSRTKWALVDAVEWVADGASRHDEIESLLRDWDRFPPPDRVVGSNVAGQSRIQAISAYWRERQVPLHWVKPVTSAGGVRNLYESPDQLGSDRWASLVGAWSRIGQACLVVSAGTAVTVDALNERGEFMGGLILPGRRMMQTSLVEETHALAHAKGQVVDFPRSTADAMESGITLALAAAVEAAYQRLATQGKPSPVCIFTGGDAEWLASQLQIKVIIAPRLVLEGLLVLAREE